MYKIDLHTHSISSPDGGITPAQYQHVIEDGLLDYIAITDHNKIEQAVELKKSFGNAVIIGEEITAYEGEIIGLFLTDKIPGGMSALETVRAIKEQGGLVYIPHPFETVRKGLSKTNLEQIMHYVDIIEVFNGRAVFQNKGPQATTVARLNNKPGAASSDAHGIKGLTVTFSQITEKPTAKNLVKQLHTSHLTMNRPPLKTLLYPKANRIRKRFKGD
jgi:predicted metal-dependent phosphoesterase TrpH